MQTLLVVLFWNALNWVSSPCCQSRLLQIYEYFYKIQLTQNSNSDNHNKHTIDVEHGVVFELVESLVQFSSKSCYCQWKAVQNKCFLFQMIFYFQYNCELHTFQNMQKLWPKFPSTLISCNVDINYPHRSCELITWEAFFGVDWKFSLCQ